MEKFDAGTTVFCTTLILVLALAAPPVHSATWYVNDGDTTGDTYTTSPGSDAISDTQNSPDTPFRTIGRALQATSPGDTVAIDSGTFNENVSFDTNNLKLLGADTTSTFIEGRINKSGGSGLEIRQLSVINSAAAGINLTNISSPTIESVYVGNTDDEAISLNNLTGAMVRNTVGTGAGLAGIAFDNVDGSTVSLSTFGNNEAAGVEFLFSTNNQISNTLTEANGQGGSSSGFDITNSSFDNTFKNNVSRSNANHGFEVASSTGNRFESNQVINNADNGISLISSSNGTILLYNLIADNANHGIRISSTNNIQLIKNELKQNSKYQISLNNSSFQRQSKNNVIPSTTNPDSLVINQSATNLTMERNWWNTTDTSVMDTGIVNSGGGNVDYIPFRLGKVDTAPGADSVAPSIPADFNTDTSAPGKVQITWSETTQNEESQFTDFNLNGYRIYRTQNPNVTDWKQHLLTEINSPSDTSYVDTTVARDTTYYYRVTAFDSPTNSDADVPNESFYSPIHPTFVPQIGPGIFVNDDETAGDVFTTNTGNDSNVGIAQHPVRTIEQALSLAQDGDTIYVDAGTYGETVTVDTPGITVIGAGQSLTHLDGDTTGGTGITVNDDNFHVRELTVENYGMDGIDVNASNLRATNLTFRNNGDNGLQFSGGSNGYVAQATFDSNANAQVHFTGGDSNTVQYSNIFPSPTNPDSGVTNTSGNPNPVIHNWWTTTDSDVINRHVSGPSDYIPHRLGIVDTGVNADTIAPAAPDLNVDTSVAQQLSLNWSEVNSDENSGPETGHEGYRVFKIEGVGDTPDWTAHRVATLGPSDTRWVDTNVEKSQPYSYRMTSFDTATPENESYFSAVRSGTWFNRPPVPDQLSLVTQVDSPVGFTVSGTDADGDTLTFRLDDPPANGTISGTLPVATYRPDTGFTGVDTFTFVITDGQDTSLAETVTVNVATLLKVNVSNITTTATDTSTPAIANGTDTVGIRVTYKNTGTGTGIVRRDTDQLRVLNALGRNVADSFDIAMSGTDVVVPLGDTTVTRWVIHTPTTSPDSSGIIGNFRTGLIPNRVTLEDAISGDQQTLNDTPPNRRTVPFQIISEPDTYDLSPPDNGLDNLSIFNQTISFIGGLDDNESMFDISSIATDGDSVIVAIQRGEVNPDQNVNTLDTPTLDPSLNIDSESDFEDAVRNADENLINKRVSGSVNFVDTGLFSVSIWLNEVGSTYIGDAANLSEDVTIRIKNVSLPSNVTQPDRLEIVKLVNDGNWSWETVTESPQFNDGTIEFTVSSNTAENYAGFSVFRIITSGFSTSGTADETVVYPNPFVPTDGNDNTGFYGSADRAGIHFGAGPDRGFPPNTTIKIYTIRGQLVDKETTNSGGIIQWDAHTENGDPAASGVYIYRIEVPNRGDKVGKFAIVR
jgi:parallel beta-helix repeat protein